ncbi:unnamed protein product [Rhodiola kirilowii]
MIYMSSSVVRRLLRSSVASKKKIVADEAGAVLQAKLKQLAPSLAT